VRVPDVLDLAAREHRELQRALRRLVASRDRQQDRDELAAVVSSIARHEALDRLLLYPLVGRDGYGRRSLIDRRAEQRSISDQLAKAIRTVEDEAATDLQAVLEGTRVTFIGHSDREEIEDFPHARRLSSADERCQLAELRQQLRERLLERLPSIPVPPSLPAGGNERLGPVQVAIVSAKEILVDLDRSATTVA
jgi:hypothetical protein